MDDQIRRLVTNLITFGLSQCPVESSQTSLMPIKVSQSHSTVDHDIPGRARPVTVIFTVPSSFVAKTRFRIISNVIRAANQAGVSPNCLQVPHGTYR